MSAPLYVAAYGGFVVIERYDTPAGERVKAFTVADSRLATPFSTFLEADTNAKWAVSQLYPPDIRYYAILTPCFGDQDA